MASQSECPLQVPQLYLLHSDGSDSRLLDKGDVTEASAVNPPGSFVAEARFSPDSRRIAWTKTRSVKEDDGRTRLVQSDVYVVDVEGGQVNRLLESKEKFFIGQVLWSPDSKYLAASYIEIDELKAFSDRTRYIEIVKADGQHTPVGRLPLPMPPVAMLIDWR